MFSLCLLYHVVLSLCGGGWFLSDYLVSTQLQLWLSCCWGCGCCWPMTKSVKQSISKKLKLWRRKKEFYKVMSLQSNSVNYSFYKSSFLEAKGLFLMSGSDLLWVQMSVGRSVCWSVCRSVCLSVGGKFWQILTLRFLE